MFLKCMICNNMHYAFMCIESNKNVNKSTSNNFEKEVKKQDNSLNLLSISNLPQVLLHTLEVKIKDKNCSLIVRTRTKTVNMNKHFKFKRYNHNENNFFHFC